MCLCCWLVLSFFNSRDWKKLVPYCARCPEWAGTESWRTLCRKCFTSQKKAEEEAVRQQLYDLMAENQSLRSQLRDHGQIVIQDSGIPPEKLKALVQLCHPDKHNGSRAANDMTQWLLSQRKPK